MDGFSKTTENDSDYLYEILIPKSWAMLIFLEKFAQ